MSAKKTKVLNLDNFSADAERTITIGGVEYPVLEMTFENFVETTREAQRLEADENSTTADQLEATVRMVQRSVPTIPVETLRGMGLTKLGVIVKFLQGDMDEEIEKAAEVEAAGAEEAKK